MKTRSPKLRVVALAVGGGALLTVVGVSLYRKSVYLYGYGRGKLSAQKATLAMAVLGKNRHYRIAEIECRHWLETAKRCGMPGMRSIIADILDQTPRVLDEVRAEIPKLFPEPVAEAILNGLKVQAEHLGRGGSTC